MPFTTPFKTKFEKGDLIYGYNSEITTFIDDHKPEGATQDDTVRGGFIVDIDAAQRASARSKASASAKRCFEWLTHIEKSPNTTQL